MDAVNTAATFNVLKASRGENPWGTLPVKYPKNRTPWHSEIAGHNMILQARVGSVMHGCNIPDQPTDTDLYGICIEPPQVIFNVAGKEFEQYEYSSSPPNERTSPTGLDITIVSLRKFARQAAKGDLNFVTVLFEDPSRLNYSTPLGLELIEYRDRFISQQTGMRTLKYLDNQVERYLLGKKAKTNRSELIDEYGWDVKAAYHALRIAYQGYELMEFGKITLPMMEDEIRATILEVRRGLKSKKETLDLIAYYRRELADAHALTSWPPAPDYTQLNVWIASLYRRYWNTVRAWDEHAPHKPVEEV